MILALRNPAFADTNSIDLFIATDDSPDVCYWSVGGFSTNSIFWWECGIPLSNPDRLHMFTSLDLIPDTPYTSVVSSGSGHVCDALLIVFCPCYDLYVNGKINHAYPNWRDGYYLGEGPLSSSFKASFYITPSAGTLPIAQWQVMNQTGRALRGAYENGQYQVTADGMSRAIGSVINTTYPVTFVLASAPAGCTLSGSVFTAGTNTGSVHIKALTDDPTPCLVKDFYFNLNDGSCPNCGSGSSTCSKYVNQCVDLRFNLGPSRSGAQNAYLEVESNTPSLSLGSPQSLQCNFLRPELEVITNSMGWLRQVRSLDRLVDINTNTATSYFLNYYHTQDILGFSATNGLYYFTNSPFQSIQVMLVGGSTNHLEVMDSSEPAAVDYYWATNGWTLATGGGLRYDTKISMTNGAICTNVETIADGQNNVNYQTVETWQTFSYGNRLLQRTIGSGPMALTETYAYTADGMLQQASHSDGSWDIYTYDASDRQIGHYSPFLNSSPTTNMSLCRFTASTYTNSVVSGSGDDANLEPYTPRQVVDYVLGNEVGRSYTVVKTGERDEIQCANPGDAWNNSSNLVTVTYLFTDALNLDKPSKIIRPDGTIQVFTYTTGTTCPLPGTDSSFDYAAVWTGAPDSGMNYVVDGTLDETWTDYLQNKVLHRVTDVASSVITEQEKFYYDALNHVTNTVYLNRTSAQQTYDCCNLQTSLAPDGTLTSYGYDALKRRIMTVQNGITVSNILNANGDTLGTVRYGTDGSAITNNLSTYSDGGVLTGSTDGLGNVTTYTNYFDGSGQLIKVTTYPDLSTRTETYAMDGSLVKVTGSAVLPVSYVYDVESDGGVQRLCRQEIKLTAGGATTSEWTKTYTDMLGRAYKTVYSSASGTPASQSIYNSLGQLAKQIDPDGVTTLYQYNARGQVAYSAVDMNANGVIDFGGLDRITGTVSDVVSNGYNLYVNRTRTYVWEANNSAISNLVAMAETSVDGLQNWNIVYNNGVGLTNYSQTTYVPSSGLTVVTGVAPDGSASVSTSVYGQLMSVVRSDAKGGQIGGTTFGYDAQGRQNVATDARNGSTVSFFNNNDQVTAALTPSPDGVQGGQLTTNLLDSLGRVIKTILPDGTGVTNVYAPSGLLTNNFGSRTYATADGYDYAGRMQTLTTWTNAATKAGAAVTAWNYDGYRGFLTNKAYADGKGPNYAYTAAGRLQSRTWARGTNTAYGYNVAGDLSGVSYSDATPGMTNGFDRLGRQVTVTNGSTVCVQTYNDVGELLGEAYTGGPLNGLSVTNGYDSLLRRTSVSLLNASSVILASTKYSYDAASRLQTVSDGTNTANYSYLANSPLVGQIAFANNGATRMTTTKQYDLLNRLTAISSAGVSPVASFNYAYNSANQRALVTNVDNSYWNYQYDFLGQVTSGKRYWADGTPVAGQQFTYNFDDIGNRKSTAAGGDGSGLNLRTANYTANNLNQYTSRDVPGYVDVLGSANANATVTVNLQRAYRYGSYFWDELSENNASAALWLTLTNLAVLNNGTNADIVATNMGNMLVPQTPETFGYDNDGDMTNSGRWTITWDAENRATSFTSLSSVPTAAKKRIDCAYDYQGRRVQKIISTNNGSIYVAQSTNKFVYDGWNLIGILDGGNNLLYSFQWGLDLSGSLQGAGGVGGLISMTVYSGTNVGTYFYAHDGNGNVAALVNAANNALAAQYEYDPFLGITRASGALAFVNPFLGSTKFFDAETGLYYYGFRYYDPSAGRWLSRDPIEENGGTSIYGYVGNSSPNYIDNVGLVGTWTPPSSQNAPPSVATPASPSYKLPTPYDLQPNSLAGDINLLQDIHYAPAQWTYTRHTIHFKTSSKCKKCSELADEIYRSLKTFSDWKPNSYADATPVTLLPNNAPGVAFYTPGDTGSLMEMANMGLDGNGSDDNPVYVSLAFNSGNRVVTGRTLGHHMLVGVRKWSISYTEQGGICSFLLSTWAVDATRNVRNMLGSMSSEGREAQAQIWVQYLNNIVGPYRSSADFVSGDDKTTADQPIKMDYNPFIQ